MIHSSFLIFTYTYSFLLIHLYLFIFGCAQFEEILCSPFFIDICLTRHVLPISLIYITCIDREEYGEKDGKSLPNRVYTSTTQQLRTSGSYQPSLTTSLRSIFDIALVICSTKPLQWTILESCQHRSEARNRSMSAFKSLPSTIKGRQLYRAVT